MKLKQLDSRLTGRLMPRRTFVVLLVVMCVLLLLAQQLFEYRLRERVQTTERAVLIERLGYLRYQLESRLANNLALVNGLAAFIAAYPDFTEAEYARYAATVLAQEPSLINLAAAPDMVIRHIYPPAGNEPALGLDYMQEPSQRAVVERAVATGAMVVAGPVELVQGGEAIIGRAPVHVSDGSGGRRLWGIVSGPIPMTEVHELLDRFDPTGEMRLALRGADGLGAAGEVFVGDAVVFDHPLAVTMPVTVGGGLWQLAALPNLAPASSRAVVWVSRVLVPGVTALLVVALWRRRRLFERNWMLEQRALRDARFLGSVESVSRVGGWRLRAPGVFTELSAQARSVLGLEPGSDEVPLSALRGCFDPAGAAALQQTLIGALERNEDFETELSARRAGGERVWLQLRGEPSLDPERADIELIGAIQDVTAAHEQDDLIHYQANYDGLTGLANRTLFLQRLEASLLQSKRSGRQLAVLFLDLDNFKSVNDNHGHDAGDTLLRQAAERIQSGLRRSDMVARYSGDEFVAIVPDIADLGVVMRIVDTLVTTMARPFQLDAVDVYCSVSVGIACYPDDASDADTLLIKADQAMYEAKRRGRNGWQFYTAAMQEASERKHRLFNDLLQALEQQALEVYFQPIVDVHTREPVAVEALVRWRRADGSWVSPEAMVAVAEERGVINRLDHYVLVRALDAVRRLNRRSGRSLDLSVNISPRLLQRRDQYSRDWFELLGAEGEIAVTVELTERMFLERADSEYLLAELDRNGIRIAIDDFGTGYSSLAYLSRFPVRTIKIDRSFVAKLMHSGVEASLIESIILLGDKLSVTVVAEGVETAAQLRALQLLGCHQVQGYFLAQPMDELSLSAFLLASHD